MRWSIVYLLVPLLALISGCARGETSPAPPDIRYGEDICVECNMIISDARFAAGYAHEITPGRYQSKAFDDIGDMLVHARKNPNDKVSVWYVHDYESEEWLDASEAIFVISPDLPTPMGYGILAYADETAAQAMAAQAGARVLTWNELLAEELTAGHMH
jgi:copper chaperone NosL